jgi:hypothetical protein
VLPGTIVGNVVGDNPEKLATLGTPEEEKENNNTQ